jgi:hypothetical protein
LVHVDAKARTFYQTYCGEPAQNSPEVQTEVKKMLEEIASKWGLHHSTNRFKPRFKTPDKKGYLNNVTQLNGKLFIIDFGSSHWSTQPHKNKNKNNNTLNTTTQKSSEGASSLWQKSSEGASNPTERTDKPKSKKKSKIKPLNTYPYPLKCGRTTKWIAKAHKDTATTSMTTTTHETLKK